MKELYQKIPSFIRNRYFVTGLVFVVWIAFFDSYNFIYHGKLTEQRDDLKKELIHLSLETKKNKDFIRLLDNPAYAEKYAREKFLMKKEDEDIFIVEKKAASNK